MITSCQDLCVHSGYLNDAEEGGDNWPLVAYLNSDTDRAERKKIHTTDSHLLAFCNRNLLPPVILKQTEKRR